MALMTAGRVVVSAGVAASIVALGMGISPPAASADYCDGGNGHEVSTMRSNHLLVGMGYEHELSGNREEWCDLQTQESCHGCGIGLYVCDYQGQVAVYNPDGSYGDKIHTGGFHSGCSYKGWNYHDPIQGIYAEDKKFKMKWRSEVTPNGDFQGIGTIHD